MASHLEQLLAEYYEWQGYLIRRNIKVGRRIKGGWEMELDIVAWRPGDGEVLHIEPSIDAHKWSVREQRYRKKFDAGKKYIRKEVMPWLEKQVQLKQIAIFISAGPDRRKLAGGVVRTIDEVMAEIKAAVSEWGPVSKKAIPEQFALLRTIQLMNNGYYRTVVL